MAKVDIKIEITFDIEHPEKSVIRTNAKKEALEEILDAWVREQIGSRVDKSKAVQKKEYKIDIGLELAEDVFHTTSDTGNAGFTCGIVMYVMAHLPSMKIVTL